MTALSADLRSSLCRLYALNPEASDGGIIRAAENAATAGADLAALLKALGHAKAADALAALPDIMGARSKLTELLAQFDSLMRADAAADADVEAQDVSAAFSARRFGDPSLVHSLAAHRGSLIQNEISRLPEADRRDVGKVRAARAAGRTAFLSHYGVVTNPQHVHLTRTFVAGPGPGGTSAQFQPPPMGAPVAPPVGYPQPAAPTSQPMQLSQQPGGFAPPPAAVDLSAYEGNTTQRIIQHLSAQDPNFKALDIGTQISRASAWRRANGHLLVQPAAA